MSVMAMDSSPILVRLGTPVTPTMSPRRMTLCVAENDSGEEALLLPSVRGMSGRDLRRASQDLHLLPIRTQVVEDELRRGLSDSHHSTSERDGFGALDRFSIGHLTLDCPFSDIRRNALCYVEFVRVRVGLLALAEGFDLVGPPLVEGLDMSSACGRAIEKPTFASSSGSGSLSSFFFWTGAGCFAAFSALCASFTRSFCLRLSSLRHQPRLDPLRTPWKPSPLRPHLCGGWVPGRTW